MSFHKKVLIGYILFNVIWIPLGLYVMPAIDYATAADPDLVAHAMGEKLGPIATITSSALIVALLYVVRGLVKLGAGIIRKLLRRG
jgi:hypothetical protein